MPGVPPVCLSMVVCDDVVRDRTTGKATLVGVFRSILAAGFPAVHPALAVWVELTSGHGEAPLDFMITRGGELDAVAAPMFSMQLAVAFADPLAVLDFHLKISDLTLPEAGDYRFLLECEGVPLFERRIRVDSRQG